jgi:hypothetical protein
MQDEENIYESLKNIQILLNFLEYFFHGAGTTP